MAPRQWLLVGALAFIFLAVRMEVREAALALIDPLSPLAFGEPFRPGILQLGVLVLALTGGLALLVRWLELENRAGRYGGSGPGKGLPGRAVPRGRADTPVGMYQSKKGGLAGRR